MESSHVSSPTDASAVSHHDIATRNAHASGDFDPDTAQRDLEAAFSSVIAGLSPATATSSDVSVSPARSRFGNIGAASAQQPLAQEVARTTRAVGSAITNMAAEAKNVIVPENDANNHAKKDAAHTTLLVENMWHGKRPQLYKHL